MKKLVSLLLALTVALCGLPALAESSEITVTDMMGRTVTLSGPATRVVGLTASNIEILYAIGAGDLVVGRGTYCTYPEEALAVTDVQSGAETNVEEIIALQPDLVIMDAMAQTEEQVNALEAAGIPVVMTQESGLQGVYDAITLIGAVTGCDEAAAALVTEMTEGFAAVQAAAADFSGMTVYLEVSGPEWGDPWVAGSGTMMDELIGLCGLTNAFADVSGWGTVSVETILERDPDLMILTDGYTDVDSVTAREGWDSLSCVRNGLIFKPTEDIQIPGPRLLAVAQELLAFLQQYAAEVPAA